MTPPPPPPPPPPPGPAMGGSVRVRGPRAQERRASLGTTMTGGSAVQVTLMKPLGHRVKPKISPRPRPPNHRSGGNLSPSAAAMHTKPVPRSTKSHVDLITLDSADEAFSHIMASALVVQPPALGTTSPRKSPSRKASARSKKNEINPLLRFDKHGFHKNKKNFAPNGAIMDSTHKVSEYVGPLLDEDEMGSSSDDSELAPDYSEGGLLTTATDLTTTQALAHKRLGVRRRKVRELQRTQITKLRQIETRVANLITKYENRERQEDRQNVKDLQPDPDYTPLSTEDDDAWTFQNQVNISRYTVADQIGRLTERQMNAEEILFRMKDWMDNNHLQDVQDHMEPVMSDKNIFDRPEVAIGDDEPEDRVYATDGVNQVGVDPDFVHVTQRLDTVVQDTESMKSKFDELSSKLQMMLENSFTLAAKEMVDKKDGDPVGTALSRTKTELIATKKQLATTSRALIEARKEVTKTQSRVEKLTRQLEDETDNNAKTIAALELRIQRSRDVQERLRRNIVDMRRDYTAHMEQLEHKVSESEVHVELLQAKAKAQRDDPGARLRKNKKSRALSSSFAPPSWTDSMSTMREDAAGDHGALKRDSTTVHRSSMGSRRDSDVDSIIGRDRRASSSEGPGNLKTEKHILAPGLVVYFPIDDDLPFTRQHYADTYKKLVQYHAVVKSEKLKIESSTRGQIRSITEKAEEEKAQMEAQHEMEIDELNTKLRTLKMTAQQSLNQLTNEHQHAYQAKDAEVSALRAENYKYIQQLNLIKDAPQIQKLMDKRMKRQEILKSITNLSKLERNLDKEITKDPDGAEDAIREKQMISAQLRDAYDESNKLAEELEDITGNTGDGPEIISGLKAQVMRLKAENDALNTDKEILEVRLKKRDSELHRILNKVDDYQSMGSRNNLDRTSIASDSQLSSSGKKKKKGKGKRKGKFRRTATSQDVLARRSDSASASPHVARRMKSSTRMGAIPEYDSSPSRNAARDSSGSGIFGSDVDEGDDDVDESDGHESDGMTQEKISLLEQQLSAVKSENHTLHSQIKVLSEVVEISAQASIAEEEEANAQEGAATGRPKPIKKSLQTKLLRKLDLHHDELMKARLQAAGFEEKYQALRTNAVREQGNVQELRQENERLRSQRRDSVVELANLRRAASMTSAHVGGGAASTGSGEELAMLKRELSEARSLVNQKTSLLQQSRSDLNILMQGKAVHDVATDTLDLPKTVELESTLAHKSQDGGDPNSPQLIPPPTATSEREIDESGEGATRPASVSMEDVPQQPQGEEDSPAATGVFEKSYRDVALSPIRGLVDTGRTEPTQSVVTFDPEITTHSVDTLPSRPAAAAAGSLRGPVDSATTITRQPAGLRQQQEQQQQQPELGVPERHEPADHHDPHSDVAMPPQPSRPSTRPSTTRPSTSATGTSLGGGPITDHDSVDGDGRWDQSQVEVGSWDTGEVIKDDYPHPAPGTAEHGQRMSNVEMDRQLQQALARAMQAEEQLSAQEAQMLERAQEEQEHYEQELGQLTSTIQLLGSKVENLEEGLSHKDQALKEAHTRLEELETELDIFRAAGFTMFTEPKPKFDKCKQAQLASPSITNKAPIEVKPVVLAMPSSSRETPEPDVLGEQKPAPSPLPAQTPDSGSGQADPDEAMDEERPTTSDLAQQSPQPAREPLPSSRDPSPQRPTNAVGEGSVQERGPPPTAIQNTFVIGADGIRERQVEVSSLLPEDRRAQTADGHSRGSHALLPRAAPPKRPVARMSSASKGAGDGERPTLHLDQQQELVVLKTINQESMKQLVEAKRDKENLTQELKLIRQQLEQEHMTLVHDQEKLRKKLNKRYMQMSYYRDQVRELQATVLSQAQGNPTTPFPPSTLGPAARPHKKLTIPQGVISTASKSITIADVQESSIVDSTTQFSRGATPGTPSSRQAARRPSPFSPSRGTRPGVTSTAVGSDAPSSPVLPPLSPNGRNVSMSNDPGVAHASPRAPVHKDVGVQSDSKGSLASLMQATNPAMFQAQLTLMKPSELQGKVSGLLETLVAMGNDSDRKSEVIDRLVHRIAELESQSSTLARIVQMAGLGGEAEDESEVPVLAQPWSTSSPPA